ncbi:Hsp20 family protein [Fodinicurvata sp. EGI_FJ10296]|uniref:Hsp20 family protein n=1 Tax=Fodinicurvata sp. EGI_FJ10296 TaxID=3231908 RepID=UPI0034531682
MNRISVFNSPLMVGFEQFERALDRVAKSSSDGYPPYNIERLDDDHLRIVLAVAGFRKDEIQVQVNANQLGIRGRQIDESSTRVFLHRGIAARQFQKSFVLAEGLEVVGAVLADGLLSIDLKRPEPEDSVRTIPIEVPEASPESAIAETFLNGNGTGLNGNGTGNGPGAAE